MRVSGYVIAGLLVLGSQLNAQPASSVASSSPPASGSPLGAPAATEAAGAEANTGLSMAAMKVHAEELVSQMTEQMRQVGYAQVEARRAKDVLKLTCVENNELVMKGLLRIAEDASADLDHALTKNDREHVAAAYRRIAEASSECDDNAARAGQCASSATVKVTRGNDVRHGTLTDDPTDDCDIVGLANCQSQPLEYVAFASPFTPD